jgi:hypothetical protein
MGQADDAAGGKFLRPSTWWIAPPGTHYPIPAGRWQAEPKGSPDGRTVRLTGMANKLSTPFMQVIAGGCGSAALQEPMARQRVVALGKKPGARRGSIASQARTEGYA